MTALTLFWTRWSDAVLYGLLGLGLLDAAYFAVFCLS